MYGIRIKILTLFISALLINLDARAQVLLDIEGAILIGDSDQLSPEIGTIRWNPSLLDFEGYTDAGWESLTNNANLYNLFGSNNQPLKEFEIPLIQDSIGKEKIGISLDIDNNTIIVGSQGGSLSDMGTAYIFERNNGLWTQVARLAASDSTAGDHFGWSTAIHGNYAVIGAYGNDDNGNESGAAYIFKRDSLGTWEEQIKLTASDANTGDQFGWSVDIQSSTVVVTSNARDTFTGRAYVFNRTGNSWTETSQLNPMNPQQLMRFGWSCALEDSVIVVGAITSMSSRGSAFVFRNNGTQWIQEAELKDPDGAVLDRFGRSVSIGGNNIIIGAYKNDEAGTDAGAVFSFQYGGSSWQLQQKLIPINEFIKTQYFGWAVAHYGDYLVIGADLEDVNGMDSGASYLYLNVGSSWSFIRKLAPSDAMANAKFGWSVAIYNTDIVIGAPEHVVDSLSTGSIYIY